MSGIICGTGSYVPPYSMDNNDIAKLVETSDEWIRERTGVVRRHIIQEETTVSMAARAGQSALENAGIKPEEVDLILVSTISSNVILPCAACEVQRELGAVNATCFDLNAACTGFLLGYNTAAAYLAAGGLSDSAGHRERKPLQSDQLEGPEHLHIVWRRSGRGRDPEGRRKALPSGYAFQRGKRRGADL